ncbi:hydrolase (plasmid) [Azospirillum argentinense]|uniref:HD domain-containing protein n=2 Tax=Azospirillum TaxID=191 RepID=A0A2K1FW39_9PROT|nr:HD domain-containing protein [Azospirillum argentinense]AIB15484.1 hydrolase [Azospirillum argentinense]EZQ04268.1 hydrolase [Azospirillum argentinense]PNQ96744.1 HD domain-containing protein [Azospirillum argentinense]QCN98288.1 HD domain-containing protein [Azospirillum argentinense]QCO05114.1 HD domain-containing protein [Azospirillum argentinense]
MPKDVVLSDVDVWESSITTWLRSNAAEDPAHDVDHLLRVWRTAKALAAAEAEREGGPPPDMLVVLAAALLHDIVNVPKDHPDRSRASRLSADRAEEVLRGMGFPDALIPATRHAIEAHSYSAGIPPLTIEAKLVQDADRLESLGAIGIARCFATSGLMKRALFHGEDPMAETRPLDDLQYALDHFKAKLLLLPNTMQTPAGRARAQERAAFLLSFQVQLLAEIAGDA